MDNVKDEWKDWCRLCAKAGTKNMNIFSESELPFNNSKVNFIAAINEHFHVQILKEEDLPQVVCTECLTMIDSLVQFTNRVRHVQEMYNALKGHRQNANLDLLEDSSMIHTLNLSNAFRKVTKHDNKIKCDRPLFIDETPSQAEMICEELSEVMKAKFDAKSICTDPLDKESAFELWDSPRNKAIGFNCVSKTSHKSYMEGKKLSCKEFEEDDSANKMNIIEKAVAPYKKNLNKCKYLCGNCPQSFQRITDYRLHIRKEHSHMENIPILEEKQVFACPKCDVTFPRKSLMSQHVKSVHADKSAFVCEECGDIIGSRTALRDHKFTHTNYAPFECKVCGRRFKQETRLKKHMDIHGDKHICDECGLQLSSRATLYCHLLVHSDAMPHKCDYCGRAFKRSKTLKNHLILHTGLKPYSCDFCDKTFSNSTSCRTHKKNMHPKEFADQEASGVKPSIVKNIPNLAVLKAVTRTAKNLTHVAPKRSGNFSCGRKRKLDVKNSNEEPTINTVTNDNFSSPFEPNE